MPISSCHLSTKQPEWIPISLLITSSGRATTTSPGYLDGCKIPLLFICQPLVRMDANPSPCLGQPRSQNGYQSLSLSLVSLAGGMDANAPVSLAARMDTNLSPCHLSALQPEWTPISPCTCQPSSQNECQPLSSSPANLASRIEANLSPHHLSASQVHWMPISPCTCQPSDQNRCQSLLFTCQPCSRNGCQSLLVTCQPRNQNKWQYCELF
jgi:hypothetical protein